MALYVIYVGFKDKNCENAKQSHFPLLLVKSPDQTKRMSPQFVAGRQFLKHGKRGNEEFNKIEFIRFHVESGQSILFICDTYVICSKYVSKI